MLRPLWVRTPPQKSTLPSSWALPPEARIWNGPNAGPALPEHKPQYVCEAFLSMWNQWINNSLLALNKKHASLNLGSWIGSRPYVIPGWKGYSCKHAWWLEATAWDLRFATRIGSLTKFTGCRESKLASGEVSSDSPFWQQPLVASLVKSVGSDAWKLRPCLNEGCCKRTVHSR